MLHSISRYGRLVLAAALVASLPIAAQAGVIAPHGGMMASQPDFRYGPIKFHPKQILIAISSQLETTANFRVFQKNNTQNRYRAVIGCALNLGKKPRVKITGTHGMIHFAPTGIPIGTNLLCQVTVLGEGGVTGVMPVYVTVGL